MQAPFSNCSLTIRQVTDKILSTRRITRQDQLLLMSVLSQNSLNQQEQNWVNKIYEDLHKGFIRVVD